MEEKKYIITENEQKQRLDTYVASLDLKLTRSQAQRMIKENSILVNGQISKESYNTKKRTNSSRNRYRSKKFSSNR